MVWIFLKGKSGSLNTAIVFWGGEGTEYSISFSFSFSFLLLMMGSGKRAHGLGLCFFYFIAVLVSLVTMGFPSISFVSGFEPHSRVGFRFFSSADIFYDSVVWLGYFSAS